MSKSVSKEYVALMQSQLSTGPQPGERWKHYKGGEYEIVCRSVDEATMVQLVTYRIIWKGFVEEGLPGKSYVWTRSLIDFLSMVLLNDGQPTERFYRISEAKSASDESENGSRPPDVPPDRTGCPEKPSEASQTAYGSPTVGTPCRSLRGDPQCHDCRRWFRPIDEYEPGTEPMFVYSRVLCRSCYNDQFSEGRPFVTDRMQPERRTRSQVLNQRENSLQGGCCSRFADQMGCDCLELAIDDS